MKSATEIREAYKNKELTQLEALNKLNEVLPNSSLGLRMFYLREELSETEEHLINSPKSCEKLMKILKQKQPKGSFCPLPKYKEEQK